MKKIIGLMSVCGVLLGCGASANPEADPVADTPIICAVMPNPYLKLSVYDSMTNNIVSTASVKLYYKGVAQPQTVEFDVLSSLYGDKLLYDNTLPRTVSIVVVDANYHSAVVKDLPYIAGSVCNDLDTTEYKIHLCPLNSQCL